MAKNRKVPSDIKIDLPSAQEEKKEKVERSLQEIQQEYTGLALKAGQAQYQIVTIQKELDMLNSQMRDLNFEAAGAQVRESSKSEVKNG